MIDENLICQVDVRQRKNNFSLMENTKRNRDVKIILIDF